MSEQPWRPVLPRQSGRLYQAIADAIAADVASGRLREGDRLPPQRDLADALQISLGTVTRAYAAAERRGLIHGEGRRGTIVGPAADPQTALAALAGAPVEGNIDFGANYPIYALDPPLPPALRSIARRADADRLLRYPPPEGLPQHREIGAAWMAAQGFEVSADDVIVTAGAQHAIAATLAALLSPGDLLLAEEVTYPGAIAAAHAIGASVRPVPVDDGGIDPDALDGLCRKHRPRALYCIPTLHNPTTITLSSDRKRAIAALASTHGFFVIEDEIHRALVRRPPPPFRRLCPDRAVSISSVSKVVAGGLRLGFLAGPADLRPALLQGVHATLFAASPLIAEVFATWWRDGTAARTIDAKRKEARARQQIAAQILDPVPGLSFARAESPYLWLRLDAPWHPAVLVARAQQQRVKLLPPETFAVDPGRAPRALRLSLGAPEDRAQMQAGLEIIAAIASGGPRPIVL